MRINWVRLALATTDTMTRDAYREFCWGANLPETPAGYGLIFGYGDTGEEVVTAVLADVEYARLLAQTQDIVVPSEKIITMLPDWPNLDPTASTVWS